MTPPTTESYAIEQDRADLLRVFRAEFRIPKTADIVRTAGGPSPTVGTREDNDECIYLVGNSLGLMPRATPGAMREEMEDWGRLGVEGHFYAKHPWFPYHEFVRDGLARVVGALPTEVVAMNSLTTNLHLLMVSFYRPTRQRHKIVIEDTAFPSDSYAVQSQLDFHSRVAGFDPRSGLVRLKPRAGEDTLRTEDILAAIDREKDQIALIMLGGVNYLTGQFFDIPTITRFARERGIVVGWDLAHAAGNIDLKLHDSGADFAAWCSYKYLNSGAGAIAGAFVHERHLGSAGLPRFAGWWGNDPKTRFKMGPDFVPSNTADAWALSNPPVFAMSPLRVSLGLFDRATMPALRAKAVRLTGYLESLLKELDARLVLRGGGVRITTPSDVAQRGCQLSLKVRAADGRQGRVIHQALLAAGVVTDFREPDVIRVAPVPLYNSFHDAWRCVDILGATLGA